MRHTPGPWEVCLTGSRRDIVAANSGETVASIHKWSDEVEEADARLIAAAPALKEALTGPNPETPQPITPIGWLRTMIDECERRGPEKEDDDPDAYYEMISEVERLYQNAIAAIAAAKGK